jgi:predicted nucleic acid-binding protein
MGTLMRWLPDSNVIIDVLNGVPQSLGVFQRACAHKRRSDWLGFSVISRIEVLGSVSLTQDRDAAARKLLGELEQVMS